MTIGELEKRIYELVPETEIIVYGGDLAAVRERLLIRPDFLKKILAVWSPSGGVGKTEVAKNLALAAGTSFRVTLLDANLCNPDIAQHLGLGYQKGYTLSTALELWAENRLTSNTLGKILLPYENIRVLVGSEDVIEQSDYSPCSSGI
ncbi:P-loop NTPase [Effusibacillus consociatus]|uniref:P-loop NTPase n=1 Tax=Effusibacillus consociatus TaxID=1117041 RepID=A0ABV9Q599_9BACL